MAVFADKTLKVKNVAIFYDSSSDYSKGLAEVFQKIWKAKAVKLLLRSFLAKTLNFKSALTNSSIQIPEAIYVPGYYEEVSKIIKQAREIGITCPMLGSDGWESPKLAEIAGKDALKGCYYVSAFNAKDEDKSVQDFIKKFKEK